MGPDSEHIDKIFKMALEHEKCEWIKDEIFVQLMKQTNVCTDQTFKHLTRGWKLLSICCSFFGPSPHLLPYLTSYLQTNEGAQFALDALHKSVRFGHRDLTLQDAEIRMQPIKMY